MSARLIHWESWALEQQTDARFRRITAGVGFSLLALALLVPMLRLSLPEKKPAPPEPLQVARLLPDERPVVAHEQTEQTHQQQPAPAPRQQAAVKTTPSSSPDARRIAEQSGLLQLRDQLQSLRDQQPQAINRSRTLLTAASNTPSFSSRSDLASDALAQSGATITDHGGVSAGAAGTSLGTRRTGAVQSAFNGGGTAAGAGSEPGRAGRTLQEIQLIFDRSKGAFDAIFTRTARETSGMDAGRISVSLTIAPDGSVMRCQIISSSFNNPAFEEKVLQRIRALNFGAKNVPVFTFQNYALNFLLS